MRIFAYHLLNDYSGSPKVLMQITKGWIHDGYTVNIGTSRFQTGFLTDIEGALYQNIHYRYFNNTVLRLFAFGFSQLAIFFKAIIALRKSDLVYINTVLPFAAALAGKLRGCRIIYHIHETSVKPKLFKNFLFKIARITANDTIYVSEFLMYQENKGLGRAHVVYNALENTFIKNARDFKKLRNEHKNVLMVSSLKYYKGLNEFITLAKDNPHFNFRLVLNAPKLQVIDFNKTIAQTNIEVISPSPNINKHYQWADVVVNLSHSDSCIETFGLTVLEGMAYGLPALVPQVGGITEVVEHDLNGYQVDSKDRVKVNDYLNKILMNNDIYKRMSDSALKKVRLFNEEAFIKQILEIMSL